MRSVLGILLIVGVIQFVLLSFAQEVQGEPVEATSFEEMAEVSATANEDSRYFYYLVNLIEGGGGKAGDDKFVELGFFRISLGYGRLPILLGVNLIEAQYLTPLGLNNVVITPLSLYYVFDYKEKSRHSFLYAEGSLWGTYKKEYEEVGETEIYLEEEMKEYKYRYFDIGIATSLQVPIFEIESFPLNGLEVRLGWRFADTKGDVVTPMSGVYVSAKLKLGLFGRKTLP